MRTRLHTFYLYVILAISLVGCRGCSCNLPRTYILETIVNEIQLDSQNIARIKIEHLEKTSMGFTFEYKKHGGSSKHVIRFNLQFNDRPYRNEVFEHDAVATDSMKQHKDDILVKLSEDKLHLLLIYKDQELKNAHEQPVGVYHLLPQGKPFTTTVALDEVEAMSLEFNNNSLQSPADMMLAYVGQITDFESNYNNKYIKETLVAQESPSVLDKKMLEHIGLPLADAYFDEPRVNLLCSKKKHVEWRTRATKLMYRYIGEVSRAKHPIAEETMRHADGAVNIFVNGLNKYMDKRAIERQVLPKHPFYPYAIKIFHDTEDHRSLHPKEAKAIKKNCIKLLTEDDFRETLPNEQISANQAIEFLIRYRNSKKTEAFEEMIAAIFRLQILGLDCRNLEDEILFPYDTRFSEAEQKIILKHAKRLAKELPQGETNFYLEKFLKEIDGKDDIPKTEEKNES